MIGQKSGSDANPAQAGRFSKNNSAMNSQAKTWMIKLVSVMSATAVLVLMTTMSGCSRGQESGLSVGRESKAPTEAIKVAVAPVEFRSLRETVEVVGTLRGWEELSVGAKRGGRVIKVHREMGDRVKPGDPLLEFDIIDAQLNVDQAQRRLEADLAELGLTELPDGKFDPNNLPSVTRAKIALDRSDIVVKRERSLTDRMVGMAELLQFAINDRDSNAADLADAQLKARAALARARFDQSALKVAQQALFDMKVDTPKPTQQPEGVKSEALSYAIRKRAVTEGQMIRDGDAVFELVLDDPLRVWVNAPGNNVPKIRVGQEAELSVSSYEDRKFPAKVVRINPTIDSVTRTFQIELVVPNPKRELRPGDFVKVGIVIGVNNDTAIVPVESIVRFAGNTKVFLFDEGKAREFKLSRAMPLEANTNLAEVVPIGKIIPKGAQVITTGQGLIAEGDGVVIRKPASSQADPVADAKPETKESSPANSASAEASKAD